MGGNLFLTCKSLFQIHTPHTFVNREEGEKNAASLVFYIGIFCKFVNYIDR